MLREVKTAAGLDSVVVVGVGLRRLFALCQASHSMISVDTGPRTQPRRWVYRWLSCMAPGRSASGCPAAARALRSSVWVDRGIDARDQIPVEPVFDAWCAVVDLASRRAPVTIGATIP